MRIADIVVDITKGKSPGRWPRASRFKGTEPFWGMVVRVVAEDGTEGVRVGGVMPTMDAGYSRNAVYQQASEVLGRIKPELLGRDVADREWLYSQRYVYGWWGTVDQKVISRVDEALWDLYGKLTGQPVCKLLGLARTSVPAYASAPYIEDPKGYADLAVQAKAFGYPAYKIKPGGGGVARIKEITTLTREAVGDEMALMIDGQMQFDLDESLDIGYHLQDLGFEWWEDPMPHDRLGWYDELSARLEIPIAYTDHPAVRFHEIGEMLRSHPGVRILRSDTNREGITGLKKVCSMLEGFGRNCEIHAGWPGNFQVLFSVPNCKYFEDGLTGAYDNDTNTLKRRDPTHPQYVDEHGMVHAPTAPGVGDEPDEAALQENLVERLS